jgi:hypothetical protein
MSAGPDDPVVADDRTAGYAAVVRNQIDDVEYCDPRDHDEASPHNLMVRYSTTGVEIASTDDSLRVEPWSPGVSLPFGADALLADSTLHTPPAQVA